MFDLFDYILREFIDVMVDESILFSVDQVDEATILFIKLPYSLFFNHMLFYN